MTNGQAEYTVWILCIQSGQSLERVDTLDKGMIHIPGGMERGGARFHHTAQNGMQFKIMNCLFLEFSIQYFWIMVDRG